MRGEQRVDKRTTTRYGFFSNAGLDSKIIDPRPVHQVWGE